MGANFKFNKMLPTIPSEAPGLTNPKRQLEVFELDGKTFIRIGPVGAEDAGEGRSTVEISSSDIELLITLLKK
ncbi:hypothetical protein [Burkholderia ubonensis]|uniref:hypothetical protein n=1 Tax=Burkholderia ubonensis TaxID=101571 RepID=UPI001160557A|nr:hypothetical protein [Burkholderia ubonensis]